MTHVTDVPEFERYTRGRAGPLRVAVLAIGDEIVAGDIVESNSTWLTNHVRDRGHRVTSIVIVGDEAPAIRRAVERLMKEANVVLVTGGLGPTVDDLTRDGVAAAFETSLVERPEITAELEAHAKKLGKPLGDDARRQAFLPEDAVILPNAHGTAPGFLIQDHEFVVACMPGVPTEMRAMAEDIFGRYLPESDAFATRRLHVAGVPESHLGDKLADLMHHQDDHRDDARLGITSKQGIHSITIRGNDPKVIAAMEADVRSRLGDDVFGEDGETLAGAVVGLLKLRTATVTTAESCTGGLLAGAITSVPCSSDVFAESIVTYSNDAKAARLGVPTATLDEHGAVSEPTALAMATAQRARAGADDALAVSGVAGPGGGSDDKPVGTVVIALADAGGSEAETHHWRGTRDEIRGKSVHWALEMLRRRLLRQ